MIINVGKDIGSSFVDTLDKVVNETSFKKKIIEKFEPDDIYFNNISVNYAYMTGVVSYGDYFTMGCSTFNNEITFSIGFNGNDLQLQKANNFLYDLKTELKNIN